MQRLDEFAAVIVALGAPHDRLAGLQAGQADPDALADRLPRKGEHSKAARRQVEQLGVERLLPRLAKARAPVDRREMRPAGVCARGGARDRKRVVQGTRVSVRVVSVGGRTHQKKKPYT